jgi:hypothetical protein
MNRTWKLPAELFKKQAFCLLILIFGVTVALRLPGLNRPVSKHHEFIPATVLINIISWQQAGGGAQFHYTPLYSFQHAGDRHPERAVNIDDKGNQLYLSFGPGMYMIPYFFYQALHLPVEPIYLRLLNLLLGLFTVILCFFFFDRLLPPSTANRYYRILAGCILFLFAPGDLWYFGNCFVHTALMMPFVILVGMILLPMLRSSERITALPLLALSGLIIILIYIDWFVAFLCFSVALYCLYRSFRDRRYLILALVLGVALLAGIALIFWEFASYSGAGRLALYWKYRFRSRGFANPEDSYPHLLPHLFLHLATCYLPLLVLLAGSITIRKRQRHQAGPPGHEGGFLRRRTGLLRDEFLLAGLYICALLLYVLVLTDWSTAHEFSVVPAGLLLAYLGARWLPLPRKKGVLVFSLVLCLYVVLCLGQYYFINRPGAISRDGMAYNTFEIFGKRLRQIPPGDKIFSDLKEICPMIEYYAGRNLTLVPDSASAKQLMRDWGLKRAVWAATSDFTLRGIDTLRVQ